MRGIISICLAVIGMSLLTQKPRPNAVPFRLHPTHIQYIQDSIQRPIPRRQVKILFHFGFSHPNLKGLTYQVDQDMYIIHLNRFHKRDWWKVTHHELVHVKQLVSQHLQTHATHWQWHQTQYSFETPYYKRPWELEAFKQANQIETRTLHGQ